jgi:hypothetical protein
MEGKAKFIFPVLATALVVFVATAAVTYVNIGLHCFMSTSCGAGSPHSSLAGRLPR